MKEMIEQELKKESQYLLNEGENEQDRSYFEGKIAGFQWVLAQLEKEGANKWGGNNNKAFAQNVG